MKVQVVCAFVSFIRSCFCKHVQTTCSSSYGVYKHSWTCTMYVCTRALKQLSPVLFPPTPPSFFTSVPSFVVRLYKTRIYTSKVYENFRKTDTIVDLMLPQPVPLCGDIKIEFFHNGWKKVRVSWAATVAQLVEHSV